MERTIRTAKAQLEEALLIKRPSEATRRRIMLLKADIAFYERDAKKKAREKAK